MGYILGMRECAITFSLESDSGLCVIKTCLIHDLDFVYVVEAFITLN